MATADKITLPADWCSYLIYGDADGLNDGEEDEIEAHLKRVLKGRIVDMDTDSIRFTWSYDLYGGNAKGGDVADYTVLA